MIGVRRLRSWLSFSRIILCIRLSSCRLWRLVIRVFCVGFIFRGIFFCRRFAADSGYRKCYFQGFVCFDHVVKGVDCEIIVDDLLLALALLVCKLQVDINNLLDFATTVLNLQKALINLIDHLRIEGVVLIPLERVLVEYRLRVLPNALLDVLHLRRVTVTRMRISWSR